MLSARDDGLLYGGQAAELARVRTATIRQWVHRGHLPVAGLDEQHRNLYRPADVADAEQRLRKPARRISNPRTLALCLAAPASPRPR